LDLVRSRSRPAIVFLTGTTYPSLVPGGSLDAKPDGIVSKLAPTAEIVEAVRAVASGGTIVGADVLQAARRARRRPAPRELAVIAEVATGATNRQVAERLSIQQPTVEAVLRRLFDRYSVTSRTALVRIAFSEGWLFGRAA
jgi:DNA-binding NarL/FixJ family response regulator